MSAPSEAAAAAAASSSAASSSAAASPAAAAASASNSFPASSLATVHPESLQTGRAVEWAQLEDGFCCVCEEGDGSEDNPIVYCDSCNMSVHVLCYGNPLGQRHD